MNMERLTDCAQGYCEMYCKKYGYCFGDPGDCIFKDEVKMYEALKSIEGIVPFDRLLELSVADNDGRLAVLPCKVGDTVWHITTFLEICEAEVTNIELNVYTKPQMWMTIKYRSKALGEREYKSRIDLMLGKTVFLTHEEVEKAMKGGDEG
ncbi:MAG: hypothetical protein ACI4PO_09190 [Faecousia sp.]